MLAQAIRNNLENINNLKMRSAAIPYKKQEESVEDVSVEFDLNSSVGVLDEIEVETATDTEFEVEIVEDPNELVVQFPIASDVELETKLPFFKSITYKLAQIF